MDQQKKVAIVTGASRGIGKQMALRLAQHDVNIVLGARTAEQSESEFPGSLTETGKTDQSSWRRSRGGEM